MKLSYVLALLLAIAVVWSLVFAFTAPYCTTLVDQGYKYCSQYEWGGKRTWMEPVE